MEEKKDCIKVFENGIFKENPVFVLMLGMCPTLAITTSLMNALGMGFATTFVLVMSNVMISLCRNIISDKIRIPAYIVIIASLVTVVQILMKAYFKTLYDALGIYIPLIVVNCIIFGRAESFASKNDIKSAAFDGLGMGLGFTLGISLISIIREFLGSGSILSIPILPEDFHIGILVLAPGAFLVLAIIIAIMNYIKISRGVKKEQVSCDFDCAHCTLHKVEEAKV